MNDSVNHPNHYNQGKIDVIEALYQTLPFEQFRGFMKGNVIKYTIRYENKNRLEDLDKAQVYISRLAYYEANEEKEDAMPF